MIKMSSLLVVLIATLVLAGCGQPPEEKVIGTWINSDSGAHLRFFPDGGGFFYQLPTKWSIADDSIRIKIGNADGVGGYEFNSDSLIISGFKYIHELNGRYSRKD